MVSSHTQKVELSWEQFATGEFPTSEEHVSRRIFRECVEEFAEKARQVLPDSNGRIDSAVKIVLAGDVEMLEDDTAKVGSQSNGSNSRRPLNRSLPLALSPPISWQLKAKSDQLSVEKFQGERLMAQETWPYSDASPSVQRQQWATWLAEAFETPSSLWLPLHDRILWDPEGRVLALHFRGASGVRRRRPFIIVGLCVFCCIALGGIVFVLMSYNPPPPTDPGVGRVQEALELEHQGVQAKRNNAGQVTHVDFDAQRLTAKALLQLVDLTALRQLNLNFVHLDVVDLSSLQKLTQLQVLS